MILSASLIENDQIQALHQVLAVFHRNLSEVILYRLFLRSSEYCDEKSYLNLVISI